MKLNLGFIVGSNSVLKFHRFVIDLEVKYSEGRNLTI